MESRTFRLRHPRASRLRTSEEFALALKRRPVATSSTMRIHFAPSETITASARHRLGIVAPKKLLRTSTRRNAAKRQIRETFRQHQHQLAPGNYVVRIVAHDRARTLARWRVQWRSELRMLWSRLQVPHKGRAHDRDEVGT